MGDEEFLAERFEAQRSHLRAVAYRMLGSFSDADDAVQEAWLRLSRADTSGVDNLGGWLTTVVGRVCLDMLRSGGAARGAAETRAARPGRQRRRRPRPGAARRCSPTRSGSPCSWSSSSLNPAERLAFVLHDMFAVPFDEIAPILGRSPDATEACWPAGPAGGCRAPPVPDR